MFTKSQKNGRLTAMKHTLTKSIIRLLLTLTLVLTVASCTSVPSEIPEELTAREIVQYAQTAYDDGNTKIAEKYYRALLERYGSEMEYYIEAKFEIAHLYIKKKQYDKAEPLLREILDIYANSMPGQYPSSFKKLAELDYAKIPVREESK